MTSEKRYLFLVPLVAVLAFGAACSSGSSQKGTTVSTVGPTTSSTMSYADCQRSGEYPGGRYAVSYDNGVCTVQKPAAVPTTSTTVDDLKFSSCAEAKAKGYSNLHKGQPGYSASLDRDGDGVACDA